MKVAVVQFKSTVKKEDNVQKAMDFVEKAFRQKASLVVLPEVFHCRGHLPWAEKIKIPETIPGQSLKPLMQLAKQYKSSIVAGSIWEKSAHPKRPYNTSVFINDKGKITEKYRKRNLFEAFVEKRHIKEADYSQQGSRYVMASWKKKKIGLSICFDLRFPQMYTKYRERGAHIFTVPSAFTYETGRAHWALLLRARAVENLAYVLAPNQIGADNKGIRCWGHSMIIDPWGKVLAEGSEKKEEIIYANIDFDYQQRLRKKLPQFSKNR